MTAPALVNSTTPQTNAAQTLAVNMPASIVAGRLLTVELSHGGTMQTPSGWTQKIQGSNNVAVFYRWATGSETSTYTFSTTSGLNTITNAISRQISGSLGSGDPFDGITTSAVTAVTSAAVSLTTTVADTYLGLTDFKNASRTNSSVTAGFTLRSSPNPAVTHAFDATQASAGATGNKDCTFTVASAHSTVLYAIKPSVPNQGSAEITYEMATAASGAREPKGSATVTFDITSDASGARESRGSAAITFDLTTLADGKFEPKGAAGATFDITTAATGFSLVPHGAADITYELATAASGGRMSLGAAQISFGIEMITALGTRESRGSAEITFSLGVEATGTNISPRNIDLRAGGLRGSSVRGSAKLTPFTGRLEES